MASQLDILKGLAVTNAVALHGYVQLHFGDQIGISIYNEMKLDPNSTRIAELIGKTVANVTENENEIEFTFLDGLRIIIDMRDKAYRSPEALELNRHGLPPVIRN